jgi:hypothetical protein
MDVGQITTVILRVIRKVGLVVMIVGDGFIISVLV